MEKYLLQVLESNNRVIVPEFGAFIIKQKSPLTIIFNEFLQYNDGMLVDVISKNEGIDRDVAKEKIDAFIAEMNSALDRDGKYSIPSIGIVTKGSSGKISLEKEELKKPVKKESKASESTEKEQVQPKQKGKTSPKKSEPIKEDIIDIVADKTIEKEQKEEVKQKKEREADKSDAVTVKKEVKPEAQVVSETKKEVKPATQVVPEAKKVEKHEVQVVSEINKTKPVATEVETSKIYEAQPSKTSLSDTNKRSRTRLIIWLIIIVIVNGILIGYFFYSEELTSIFSGKSKELTEPETTVQDRLQPETLPAEEPDEDIISNETEEEPVSASETQSSTIHEGTRYYVIAGVFREESNADNLLLELKQKGFNPEKFGKIGNLFAVSYDVFSTRAEADRMLLKIQREIDPEAWIREVK